MTTKSVDRLKKSQRKHEQKKRSKTPLFIGIGITAVIIIIYIVISVHYTGHFFPHTTFDEVDISGMTLEEAQAAVESMMSNYEIIITDRDSNTWTIKASDCGLTYPDDGLLKNTLDNQTAFNWIPNMFSEKEKVIQDLSAAYDTQMMDNAILSLSCFDEANITYPVDATIAYDKSSSQYEIVPEVMGTQMIFENVRDKVKAALLSLEITTSLNDDDYVNPNRYSTDELVTNAQTAANASLSLNITYDIEGSTEVIETDTIASWIMVDDDLSVSYDESAIADYVQTLASKYNTYGRKREFKTSLGNTIEIGGGDYGWVVDKKGEKEQILADLKAGVSVEREPVYEQTALYRGENDIGDTYIEIDLSNQHLYYYKDGVKTLESDIVSGNITKGNGTPDGVFKIIYQEKDATLVGEDYESDVSYFMVFAYNVGIHDASWRNKFGGQIYKKSGSHGCVNVPYAFAEDLFAVLETGTPVVAYYRDAVELTSENAKISNAYSYKDPDDDDSDNTDASATSKKKT